MVRIEGNNIRIVPDEKIPPLNLSRDVILYLGTPVAPAVFIVKGDSQLMDLFHSSPSAVKILCAVIEAVLDYQLDPDVAEQIISHFVMGNY